MTDASVARDVFLIVLWGGSKASGGMRRFKGGSILRLIRINAPTAGCVFERRYVLSMLFTSLRSLGPVKSVQS
jgi:hypothetical protein